jgi:hypothetical protein
MLITSSFSLKKLRQPSLGTKAATFFPFFFNKTLTHFLTAELGYLAYDVKVFFILKLDIYKLMYNLCEFIKRIG